MLPLIVSHYITFLLSTMQRAYARLQGPLEWCLSQVGDAILKPLEGHCSIQRSLGNFICTLLASEGSLLDSSDGKEDILSSLSQVPLVLNTIDPTVSIVHYLQIQYPPGFPGT